MKSQKISAILVSVAVLAVLIYGLAVRAGQEGEPAESPEAAGATRTVAYRPDPKPLTENVNKGLAYLVSQQHADGGWGQGGGWRTNSQGGGRVEGENVEDPSDLGNTCIAALALVRAGSTLEKGEYSSNLAKAAVYICGKVEQSDDDSLYVTDVRDTQLQTKIGQYVDTFLAGLVLTELKGMDPRTDIDRRIVSALDKTIKKVDLNQKEDGAIVGNNGWASVLSMGLNGKFLNRAAQQGAVVSDELLAKNFRLNSSQLALPTAEAAADAMPVAGALVLSDGAVSGPVGGAGGGLGGGIGGFGGGAFRGGRAGAPSDAGVALYNFSSNAAGISELKSTLQAQQAAAHKTLADADADADEKAQAQAVIDRFKRVDEADEAAVRGILTQLDDERFIAGFGNNGGEEFLSHMNISEMLAAKGGDDWKRWDASITGVLNRVQNGDGSWSGDHCITGRTFCTSAALLTLMADRAPIPVAEEIEDAEQNVETDANIQDGQANEEE